MIVLYYLDFHFLGPNILPDDYCYYHDHPTPWWVELFYMSPASNGHPDGSMFHLLVLLLLSGFLGNFVGRRLNSKG